MELERLEVKQNQEYQSGLVRSMLKKGYSPREIIEICEVKEIGLDNETVRRILAERGANENAFVGSIEKIYAFGKGALMTLYLPFTTAKKIEKWTERKNEGIGYIIAGTGWVMNGVVAQILGFSTDSFEKYMVGAFGLALANGSYELYISQRNKRIAENLSKLEQIADESEDTPSFDI